MSGINNTVSGLQETPGASAIPGAYPSDNDLSNRSTAPETVSQGYDLNDRSSQRNKLHKPNDPRGWDQDKTPRSHQYTDSGVGLGEKNAGYTASDNYRSFEPERDSSRDFTSRQGVTGASNYQLDSEPQRQGQTLGSSTDNYDNNKHNNSSNLGAGTAASRDYTTSKEGTDSTMAPISGLANENARTSEEHPYWGDLPRGSGVYNTVVGHGSKEDDQPIHHSTQDRSLGAGAARSTAATDDASNLSQQRAFPLAGGAYDSQEARHEAHPVQNVESSKDDTRRRDARDAAAAATVASAAYPIASEHDRERKEKYAEKHAEKHREHEQPKEQKESKLHALLHRGNDNKEKAPKEEKPKKEHVHKEKREETVVAPVATRYAREDQPKTGDLSRSTEASQAYDNRQAAPQEKNSHFKEGLGLGAAGAAAYGVSKYAEDDKNKKVPQPDYDWTSSPTSKQEPTYGSKHGSHNLDSKSTPTSTQAAGYGSTREAQNPGYTSTATSSQAPTYGAAQGTQSLGSRAAAGHIESSSGDTQYNVLRSGTASGVRYGDDAAADSTSAPLNRSEQPARNDNDHSSRNVALAGAAVGAGAGAAYAQHSAANNRYEEPTTASSKYEQQPSTTTSRYEQQQPSATNTRYEDVLSTNTSNAEPTRNVATDKVEQGSTPYNKADEYPKESRAKNSEALAVGAAGVTAASAGALAYNARESKAEHAGVKGVSSTPATSSTQHAGSSHHHDQYNHLASGTPSGINLEH